MSVRPPLVLTGPPAVGKSSTAESLASARPRCAVIEVDDLRHLVLAGAVAPWVGAEGERQRLLGVRNACAVASNFMSDDFEVVITDVLTPDTVASYRDLLPGCVIIRLRAPLHETWRRAAGRQVWLTPTEFEALHQHDASHPPRADVTIDVTDLDMATQAEVTERTWQDFAKR
jgi:hypothetical protein